MKLQQRLWLAGSGWRVESSARPPTSPQVTLVFGAPAALANTPALEDLRAAFPEALMVCCSTGGEILGARLLDDSLVATVVEMERSRLRHASVSLSGAGSSFAAGDELGGALEEDDLTYVLVLSEGLQVNGSELVKGLSERLSRGVLVTGGLAGDGSRFGETLVGLGTRPAPGTVVALGFYGPHLRVGCGSVGGWDPFGPERRITRSLANVLYELDGQSALALYKRFLGEHADDLPASGLLFPLSLRLGDGKTSGVVRTILAVDERDQSMTFAGDMPEGGYARLMKANFDRVLDGASEAAQASSESLGSQSPDLAILISCIGRRLILKQRCEEEVERVREVLGPRTTMAGFYSYGEISPFTPAANCELHNQTMTVTTLSER